MCSALVGLSRAPSLLKWNSETDVLRNEMRTMVSFHQISATFPLISTVIKNRLVHYPFWSTAALWLSQQRHCGDEHLLVLIRHASPFRLFNTVIKDVVELLSGDFQLFRLVLIWWWLIFSVLLFISHNHYGILIETEFSAWMPCMAHWTPSADYDPVSIVHASEWFKYVFLLNFLLRSVGPVSRCSIL